MKTLKVGSTVAFEVLDWEEPDLVFEAGGSVKYKAYKLDCLRSDSQQGKLFF